MESGLGRVLVTGANGHLGRRLLRRIAEFDPSRTSARALVRSRSAADAVRAECGEPHVEVVELDPTDADAVGAAARSCSAAIHLIGILLEGRIRRYRVAHEESTAALARAAERSGLSRVVYASLLGADPDSPNACLASKGRAERILLESKVPAVVVRLPMVLGPGDAASAALRAQARAPLVPMLAGGRPHAQPLDARDAVAALLAALARPGLDDAVLDLAGPESLPARELVARAARLHGRHPRVLAVPLGVARALAAIFLERLPDPPATRPMLEVLAAHHEVDPRPVCARLGLELTPLDETLSRCVGPEASVG